MLAAGEVGGRVDGDALEENGVLGDVGCQGAEVLLDDCRGGLDGAPGEDGEFVSVSGLEGRRGGGRYAYAGGSGWPRATSSLNFWRLLTTCVRRWRTDSRVLTSSGERPSDAIAPSLWLRRRWVLSEAWLLRWGDGRAGLSAGTLWARNEGWDRHGAGLSVRPFEVVTFRAQQQSPTSATYEVQRPVREEISAPRSPSHLCR